MGIKILALNVLFMEAHASLLTLPLVLAIAVARVKLTFKTTICRRHTRVHRGVVHAFQTSTLKDVLAQNMF